MFGFFRLFSTPDRGDRHSPLMEEMTIILSGTICVAYTLWEALRLAVRASTPDCPARRGAGRGERVTLRFDRREGGQAGLPALTR